MIKDVAQQGGWDNPWPKVGSRADGFYKTLLAMTGHDLRHPLQIIVSVNALLSRRLVGNSEAKYLEKSRDASFQLIKQLDRLLEVLRMHERTEEVTLEPVFLKPLFESLQREQIAATEAGGVILRIVPSRAVVMSDAFLLEGILRNLIGNAIKYTARGGKIVVGCRRSKAGLRIEVHDTGVGISAENMSRIFEAFKRLDAGASHGLGLGLFIVRQAADSLGHSIDVRSTVGKGSCFAVIIGSQSTLRPRGRKDSSSDARGSTPAEADAVYSHD